MSAFVGNIDDIKNKYFDLVPVGLKYCEHYLIYFALLAKEWEIDLDTVTSIEELIDVSKTSYQFVDGLWQYLNSHRDDKNRALDFYNAITDNLIAYGVDQDYLSMYEYLVPQRLENSREYRVYLVHLVEFYKDEVDTLSVPDDLADPDKVSLDLMENVWSFYNYNSKSELDRETLQELKTVIRDIWEQKREEYLYLVPEYLRTNEGFLVFLTLMIHEFDISQRNIENFTNLVDSDKVPLKFIEDLGAYVNYRYLERADEDFNREALLSMRSIWEMRGTDHSIIMAATHGYNPGYVGGDMFIPGYPITNELAELIIGSTRVFIHSRSKFSCIHVYPDGITYRHGVIVLIVPFVDDNIRRKIYEVMPAGVRFVFWLFIAAQSDNPEETGVYGEMMYSIQVCPLPSKGEPKYAHYYVQDEDGKYREVAINIPMNLFMTIAPLVVYENYFEIDRFTHSVSPFPSYDEYGDCYYRHLLSGQSLFNVIYQENTWEPIVCAINIDLLKIPFMGPSYTGDYEISPSGEYLDTITTNGRPGTSAVRRKFDYYPGGNEVLFLSSNVVEDESYSDSSIEETIDSAVSALPISLQKEFYDFRIVQTDNLSLWDNNVAVKDPLPLPFDLVDNNVVQGTIDGDLIELYDEGSFDINHYVVSPTGELIDTKSRSFMTVLRTYHLDYRPDVELTFLPA